MADVYDPEVVKTLLFDFYPPAATMDAATVDAMIQVAFSYRPRCLTFDMQNEAQAYYAAYLLEPIYNSSQGGATQPPSTPLIREKEGQLEREYAQPTTTGPNAVVDQSFYGRWKRLFDRCSRYTRAIR
ncbi:hypothetical protein P6F34_gp90 [Pseudomonas phage MiCath]|uniref:Uncharacterized protein n=1 Tax=Pseudomonas phage MiCath TaxID=3003729 RepID=A0AAE9VFK0_9CAUD|nr:hypothetical protein P6F34_gp90 [Pseudomonas phage MiCath]WAX22433.1 hypothetical protein [Pseudomonas phage MiCath]